MTSPRRKNRYIHRYVSRYDGIKQREPQGSVHSREAPVRIAFLSLSSHDLSKKEESLHSQVCQSVKLFSVNSVNY